MGLLLLQMDFWGPKAEDSELMKAHSFLWELLVIHRV